jgi:hypothetical protein
MAKQAANRRKNGQFAPGNREGKKFEAGESGNVKGRPRRTKVSEALIAKLAETYPIGSETTIADFLAQALIKEALKGNVAAIREICDRSEGRPKQTLDVDMAVDWRETARQYGLSEEDVIREAERLIQSATGGGGTDGGAT